MSNLYTASHRELQRQFGTEALADGIEQAALTTELRSDQIDFVAQQQMLFLATADEKGRPTVSYKGGAPGFVKVLDPQTLMFPSYDGNGMFYSLGNLRAQPSLGLLFVDFTRPNRLRIQGGGELLTEGPTLAAYPGADAVVKVAIDQVWVNCARYVHKFSAVDPSPYVPDERGDAPIAMWKRIEGMGALLSAADRAAIDQVGTITVEEYALALQQGEVV